MDAGLAYFLGFFTVIVLWIIMYIFAISFTSFRNVYVKIFANFPTTNPEINV